MGKFRANPGKTVKLSGCSMGEGCTQEEKDYFPTWVADCEPAGQSVFCAETLYWNQA